MSIKRITFFLSILALTGAALEAQPALEKAAADATQRLDSALERLADLREVIARERIPLATERDRLFAELRKLSSEADRSQRLRDNQSADLASFEDSLNAQQEVVDYLISLSSEFGRTLASQLDPSEAGQYAAALAAAESASEDPYLEPLQKLAPQKDLILAGLERAESLSGGATYPGEAIAPTGLLEPGTFIRFGPVTYFATAKGRAGLAQRGQTLAPAMYPIDDGAFDEGIVALASGEVGEAPLDATLNNALAIAATKETLLDHISKGGIWIYPILLFAGLSLTIACFKAFEILTLPKPKEGVLGEILTNLADGRHDQASHVANQTPGPVGKMLQQGVKYSSHDPELIDEILYESMVETQPKVMRLLPFISVTAAVAPLLGLLGTVTGMINTFNRIKIFGTGDAKSLSGGISEALITTEFGLIVAIPSLLLFAVLSRKAKAYLARMEKMSISFVNGIKTLREKRPIEAAAAPSEEFAVSHK